MNSEHSGDEAGRSDEDTAWLPREVNLREILRKAKNLADGTYGVPWHQLEETSRSELILAVANSAPVTNDFERLLRAMLAAQMVDPYRGWHMTALNKVADEARAFLGMPSVRQLNPDIAKMQDHIATNPDALAHLMGGAGS